MKVLIISESPLDKIGNDYYGVDPWVRIPLHLSNHFEQVTLLAPVLEKSPDSKPSRDSWKIELGKLRIEHIDCYRRYIEYYRLLFRRFFNWRKQLDKLVKEHDVVILRGPSPITSLVLGAVRRQKKPLVFMILMDLATQPDQLYSKFIPKRLLFSAIIKCLLIEEHIAVKRAALVYAYSKEISKRNKNMPKIKVIQDPHISVKDFYMREDVFKSGEIKILRICWFIPSKGIEYLLEALAMLVKKGLNVKLELVGQERTPGYQVQLKNFAARLGVSGRVTFSGWVPFDRVGDVYKRNDIQVISSLAEGTPRCIVEGFARGLPLVCTTAGGSKDFLTHEKNALLIPPADAKAIADAVRKIVSDKNLRIRMIKQGYEEARSVSFETLGVQMMDDIKNAVKISNR